MKRFLILLPMMLAASAARADMQTFSNDMRRMAISNMTCAELQSQLRSGPAILTWTSKSGMQRWGKYMSDNGSCKMQQIKVRASVATTDVRSCRVYQCTQYGSSPNR